MKGERVGSFVTSRHGALQKAKFVSAFRAGNDVKTLNRRRPQLARSVYLSREEEAQRELHEVGKPKKKKSRGRGGRKVSYAEAALARGRRVSHGNQPRFDLRVVGRRTTVDPERTGDMEEGEAALWERCSRTHFRAVAHFGDNRDARRYYEDWANKKIKAYEMRARDCLREGYLGEDDFVALRRRIGILLQERCMLDMNAEELEASGFRAAVGWYEPAELKEKEGLDEAPPESTE
ncbi:hypothetical protein PENSPDRAFT_661466 [Peniophora sp. CONT]|nr:hypothetical protein PENSPDRAFT_661466 [Peniophora sp. CONT]